MSYVEHLVMASTELTVDVADTATLGTSADTAASTVRGGVCGVNKGFRWCTLPPFHPGLHQAVGGNGLVDDEWLDSIAVEQVAS